MAAAVRFPKNNNAAMTAWRRVSIHRSADKLTTLLMKQCIAYRVSRIHRNGWVRCLRSRAQGQRFCRAHANGLHGAVLGLFMHDFFERPKPSPPATPRAN